MVSTQNQGMSVLPEGVVVVFLSLVLVPCLLDLVHHSLCLLGEGRGRRGGGGGGGGGGGRGGEGEGEGDGEGEGEGEGERGRGTETI